MLRRIDENTPYLQLVRRRDGGAVRPSFAALLDAARRRARFAMSLTGQATASSAMADKIAQKRYHEELGFPAPPLRFGPDTLRRTLRWLVSDLPRRRVNVVLKSVIGFGGKEVYLISADRKSARHMRANEAVTWEDLRDSQRKMWLVEEMAGSNFASRIFDFKAYVFQGEAPLVLVSSFNDDGTRGHLWLDRNGSRIETGKYADSPYRGSDIPIAQLAHVLEMAPRVAAAYPLPFCRVDFIVTGETAVLGEVTPFPGMYWRFEPNLDLRLGVLLEKAQTRYHLARKPFEDFRKIFGPDVELGL